jgi:hypothetical protein
VMYMQRGIRKCSVYNFTEEYYYAVSKERSFFVI